MRFSCAVVVVSLFLSGAAVSPAADVPDAGVGRYHAMLLKRPGSATLLDRFIDSWLETGDKEGLEAFLEEGAADAGAPGWQVLAAYLEWAGREAAALEAVGKALGVAPADGALLVSRAKLRAAMLDFEGALADLDAAGEAGALPGGAAALRGTYLARAGRQEEAVAAWKGMLEQRPGDEELREDLIELEVGEGLFDEAIATARELAEGTKDPYQKALRLLRTAEIESLAGRKADALTTYRGVLAMTGGGSWLEAEVLARVEAVYRGADDVAGLRKAYQELREEFPGRTGLQKGLARQMVANGETEEAVVLFRELISSTPGDVGNREEFVALLGAAGWYAEAAEELAALIAGVGEGRVELWERKAKLHDLAGDAAATDAALAEVRALRSGSAPGLVQAAALFQAYGRAQTAEEVLRAGRVAFPDAGEISEALAALLARSDGEETQAEATAIWLAMAEGAGVDGVLRVARSLLAHQRAGTAYEILAARADEFGGDVMFLQQLCQAALASDRAGAVFPHAVTLARVAKSPTELDAALDRLRSLARATDLTDDLRALVASTTKTVADWCVLATLHEAMHDPFSAADALDSAAGLASGDDLLRVAAQRARLFEARGDFTAAADAMGDLVAEPGGARPVYYRRLADLLGAAGRNEEALETVEAWKRAAPGDTNAWVRHASLLSGAGRSDEAVRELRRALARVGESSELQARLVTALTEAGDIAGAERVCQKLYDTAENDTSRLRWAGELAELASSEGTAAELIARFEKRKRSNPKDVAPLRALGQIHAVLGDYEAQHAALAAAARLRPEDVSLLGELAKVEERNGDIEAAAATLVAVTKVAPGAKSRQALADFYFRTGETELGLAEVRGLQGDDVRALENTVFGLLDADEIALALQIVNEAPVRDFRLDLLEGILLFRSGKHDAALKTFARTAETRDEIAALQPMFDEQLVAEQAIEMRRWWPEDTSEFLRNHFLLVATKPLLGTGRSNWGIDLTRPGERLPGTAHEARMFALALQINAVNAASNEARPALGATVRFPDTAVGRRQRALICGIPALREGLADGSVVTEDILFKLFDTYPHPPALLDLLEESLETIAPGRAQLAVTARIILAKSGRADVGMLYSEIIEFARGASGREREEVLQYALSEITSSNSRAAPVEQARRDLFALLDEEPTVSASGETAPWVFPALRHSWAVGDAGKSALFLNVILGSAKEPKVNARRRSSNKITVVAGAPPLVPAFTRHSVIRHIFEQVSDESDSSAAGSTAAGAESAGQAAREFAARWAGENAMAAVGERMSADVFAPHLGELADPAVRAFFQNWCGEEDAAAATVASITTDPAASPAALVFAAAFTGRVQDDLAGAFALLERARALPLSRALAVQIDGALVGAGAALASAGTAPAELPAARRAGLRLSRTGALYDPSQIAPLFRALEIPVAMVKATPRNAGSRNRMRQSSRRKNTGSVSLKADAGAVARAAFRSARKMLRKADAWCDPDVIEALAKQVPKSAWPAVLDLAAPGESGSRNRLQLFAGLCFASGDTARARPALKALAAADPDDPTLAGVYARCLTGDDFRAVVATVLDTEDGTRIADFLVSLMGEDVGGGGASTDFAVLLGLLTEKLDALAATVSPDANFDRWGGDTNISWATSMMRLATGEVAWGGEILAPIEDAPAAPQPGSASAARAAAIREFLLAGMRHRGTVPYAFALLDGYRTHLGVGDDLLVETAITSIAAAFLAGGTGSAPDLIWGFSHSGSDVNWGDPDMLGRSPAHFLAEWSRAQADPVAAAGRVYGEIAGMLAEDGAKGRFDLAASIAGAGSLEPGEALGRVGKFLWGASGEPEKQIAHAMAFHSIASLAGDGRGTLVQLEQQILTGVADRVRRGSRVDRNFLIGIAQMRAISGGSDAAEAWLRAVLENFIGQEDRWAAWWAIRDSSDFPAVFRTTNLAAKSFLENILDGGTATPALAFAVTRLPIPVVGDELDYEFENLLEKSVEFASVNAAKRGLAALGLWTRPWSEIGARYDSGSEDIVWSEILGELKTAGKAPKVLFASWKKSDAAGMEGFRRRFASAYVAEDKKRILEVLEPEAPRLLSLPAADRDALATILATRIAGLNPGGVEGPLALLFAALREKSQGELIAAVEEEIATGLKLGWDTTKRIRTVVRNLLGAEPDLCARLLSRALEDTIGQSEFPGQAKRLSRSTSGGLGVPFQQTLFEYAIRGLKDSNAATENVVQFFTTLEKCPAASSLGIETEIKGALLRNFWENGWLPSRQAITNPASWKVTRERIAAIPPETWSKIAPLFAITIIDLGTRPRWEKALGWAEKNAPELQVPFYLAASANSLELLSGEQVAKAGEIWAATLADSALTARMRLELAAFAVQCGGDVAQLPGFSSGLASTIASYLDGGGTAFSPDLARLLRDCASLVPAGESGVAWDGVLERYGELLQNSPQLWILGDGDGWAGMVKPLVQIAGARGNTTLFSRWVRTVGDSLRGELDLMLAAAKIGDRNTLAKLVPRDGDRLNNTQRDWDTSLAADLERLLPMVKDTRQRFTIECLVSSRPDARGAEIAVSLPARMLALAGRYEAEKSPDPYAALESLHALFRGTNILDVSELVSESLAEFESRWRYIDTDTEEGRGGLRGVAVWDMLVFASRDAVVARGDFSRVTSQLDELFEGGKEGRAISYSNGARSLMSPVFSGVMGILGRGEPMPEGLLESLRGWVVAGSEMRRENKRLQASVAFICAAAHTGSGNGEVFKEWRAGLSPEAAKYLDGGQAGVRARLKKSAGALWKIDARKSDRIGLVRAIFSAPDAWGDLMSSGRAFTMLLQNQVIRRSEIFEVVEALPEGAPLRPLWETMSVFHKALSQRGDITGAVGELEAIAVRSPEYAAIATAMVAELYAVVEKSERRALEVIGAVDLAALPDEDRRHFTKRIAIWQKNTKHDEDQ